MTGKQRGNLYKRGNSWYISIVIDGKLIRRSFGPDKNAAEAVLSELRKRRAISKAADEKWTGLDEVVKKKRRMPTFKEAAEEYIERDRAVWAPSTVSAYTEILRKHLLPAFGKDKVSAITTSQIARFRGKLAARVSPARSNRVLEFLRYVLNQCVEDEYIGVNPALKVKKLKQPKPDIDPLREDELELALEHIDRHYRPLFTALAWTGARPNELIALRWADIDLVRNEIRITKGRVRGIEGPPKTPASVRTIPILPPVEGVLLDLQESLRLRPQDYVFTDKKGKPITKHLDRIWARALKEAGIRHRPSYQLRHTFASLCLMQGVNPGWVQTVLGHSTMEMTFTYYARYIPDESNQQEKKLASLWKGHAGTGISSREITDQITGPLLRLVSDHGKPRRYKARRCRKRRNGASEGISPQYGCTLSLALRHTLQLFYRPFRRSAGRAATVPAIVLRPRSL